MVTVGFVLVSTVTVVCLPLTVGELAYRVWIYGQLLCKLGGYLQGLRHGFTLMTQGKLNDSVINVYVTFSQLIQPFLCQFSIVR